MGNGALRGRQASESCKGAKQNRRHERKKRIKKRKEGLRRICFSERRRECEDGQVAQHMDGDGGEEVAFHFVG